MTIEFLIGVMLVAAVWALGAYAIWLWGPGLKTRSVWCPVLKKQATILAVMQEMPFRNSYAGMGVVDVRKCSLLNGGLVACHKDCIRPTSQQPAQPVRRARAQGVFSGTRLF
jgi:hypothetical protein